MFKLPSHAHRQLIGYIGLVLPLLLIFLALARDGVARWQSLDSISAYYYTGAVATFIGMLVALALFLFSYQGYENEFHWADRTASIIAAIAALGVAFFPTAAPEDVAPLSWWSPITGIIHYVSAVTLFAMFAVFALWLFRLTASGEPIAKSIGASHVINAAEVDDVAEAIRDLTSGGAHVALEALGFTETFHNSLRCLRKMGRHVQIGQPLGSHANPGIPLLETIYYRQLTMMGSRGLPSTRFPALFEMINSGRLDIESIITNRIDLETASSVFYKMNDHEDVGISLINKIKS